VSQSGDGGELQVPAAPRGRSRGKTVMPTLVDIHRPSRVQNIAAGTMSKETFTRDISSTISSVSAFHRASGLLGRVGVGDLVDRSDMKAAAPAGATWCCGCATRSFRVRRCSRPRAPAWHGQARCPGRSIAGRRVLSGFDPEEARAAVRDYVRIKPDSSRSGWMIAPAASRR